MDSETPSIVEPGVEHKNISLLHQEWPLLVSVVSTALFFLFGGNWLADLSHPVWFAFIVPAR